MIAPNTVVHLLNVPIEEDQQNQMDFANVSAQSAYFISKVVLGQSYANGDFTYQRKDNIIRIPAEYDALQSVNYVMYQNTYYNNKWFYAFVTKKEYINANMTALYIKTDVFQTWQFDWVLKQSFVAREHVADDTVWTHTLAEPINEPEYAYNSLYSLTYDSTPGNSNTNWVYCIYATPRDNSNDIRPAVEVQGTYVEITNYTIGHMRSPGYLFGSPDYNNLKELMQDLIRKNYLISYTITIPASHVVGYDAVELSGGTFDPTLVHPYRIYGDATTSEIDYVNLSAINTTTINGHTVRNKKLNCYPYRYIQLTDDNTQSVDLKYEFLNPVHDSANNWRSAFSIRKTAGSSPVTICYPTVYESKTFDYSKGIALSSYPPVPFAIDYYSQYAALHKASMAVERRKETNKLLGGMIGSVTSAATSYFTGDSIGVMSGMLGMDNNMLDYQSYLAKYEDMKNHPPSVNNAPTGEPNYYANGLRFRLYDVYPTQEYMEYIDKFFDFYGYNVSVVKTPQFTSRTYWNYIETKNINIDGNIPQEDIQELKHIFNSGITVWHGNSASNTNWCDYSHINTIVQ